MPREPAYAAERRQDAEAKAASERAKNRMFEASVRLSGREQPRTPSTGARPAAYGSRNTRPVIVAASTAKPRGLIGTAGTVHGAQLPGR